jgi:hypothetical protein
MVIGVVMEEAVLLRVEDDAKCTLECLDKVQSPLVEWAVFTTASLA